MDNTKDDRYYLEKIKSDLAFIIEQTEGKTQHEIEDNVLLVDSIMFRIIQIAASPTTSRHSIAKSPGWRYAE